MLADYSPKVLDLFCGIGGLSLGLERAGFQTLGGVDKWPEAKKTFEHNLGLSCLQSDLTRTTVAEIEQAFGVRASDIDVIAGGPPCQGFSTIGKRELEDPRNRLWSHYRNLVAQIRPAYVIIENVEGMAVADSGGVRSAVEAAFRAVGYGMKSRVLLSADYGVPQLRKRLVFLGWLEGLVEPDFPRPTQLDPVSVADAIFDLPPLGPGEAATAFQAAPMSEFQRARRRDTTILHNHQSSNHPPHLVELMSYVPDGGNRKSIPDRLQPKSGFHNSYARHASWKPAVAVTSTMCKPSSARATHPIQHRGLTVREGLRLQSFDDDFMVLGTRTKQYLHVGNAVPPLLGEALGRSVIAAYRANQSDDVATARQSRGDGLPSSEVRFSFSRQSDLPFPSGA